MIAIATFPGVVTLRLPPRVRVVLGQVFHLRLEGVVSDTRRPVRWGVEDNDEVLEITDDGGPTAEVKAAAIGTSTMEIQHRGDVLLITFEVVTEPTTSVSMSLQNVRDIPPDAAAY